MIVVGSLLVLIAVASIAATSGFVASAIVLRKKRRARRYFALGVAAGWTAAVISRRDPRAFISLASRRKLHGYTSVSGHLASARMNTERYRRLIHSRLTVINR